MEGAGVALAVAQAGFDIAGANSEENALTVQGKQEELSYLQKSNANYDLVQNTIAAQTAVAATRGYSMASPSFNAVQIGTENKGAQVSQNLKTESDIAQDNIETEKNNVKMSLWAKLFGDVAQSGSNVYSYAKSKPSAATSNPFVDNSGGGLPGGIPYRLPGT